MKTALGLMWVSGFPYQLSLRKTKKPLPVAAVDFAEAVPSFCKIFKDKIRIYVMPDEFFVTKFREIFQQTRLTHTASAEAKIWLGGPNMKYWPQQLNFAVFCAMQGCGISCKIFDSGFSLTPQIRVFFQFHVYFTVRLILYQMGGIQSMSALPGDPTFNPLDNHYDEALYKRICAVFGKDPSRFSLHTSLDFSDEGREAIKGNHISYICQSDTIFLENLFDSFMERHRGFTFFKLSFQTGKLFVNCCESSICSFFVRGQGLSF